MTRSCTRSIARNLLIALLAAAPARADVAGQQVVSGQATFDRSGNVTTIHASDGAIINYSQFNVWANEELHFVQPCSQCRVLNRVLGDPTHIDGGLYANGIVYIVNPSGIWFGPTPIIQVGGLYAAAGDMANEDFLARVDRFRLTGTVENQGSIESPAVALLGTAVANHGSIHAPDGTIALVAGEKVLLTQLGSHIAVQVDGAGGGAQTPAIEQTGRVDAGAGSVSYTTGDVYSLAINHTGITRGREIELEAKSGTVQVAGTLDASDRSAGATGGDIAVTGERVALFGAQLDASGDAGGGSIRVGGDEHGAGALPNARRTYVDGASALRADAISSGDGGRAIVWSDEATAFHGAISARGGAAGGDGGFAEISGARFLAADGRVDLGAASGATGTLLYDPKDIALHVGAPGTPVPDDADGASGSLTGSSPGSVLFGDVAAVDEPFDIYQSELQGTNANIVLQATNGISSADTFGVQLMAGNSLTMLTRNNLGDDASAAFAPGIHLANVSFETGGAGGITIATGTDGGTGGGTGAAASIEVGNLTTAGAPVNMSTKDGAITVRDVKTQGADGAVDGSAGGDISVLALDADQSRDSDIRTGALNSSGGALNSSGGDGGTGSGGRGGAVTVQSNGAVKDIAGTTTDPTLGGGKIEIAAIDSSGGAAATGTAGGAGGTVTIGGVRFVNGVLLGATDGTITVTGGIKTSGGDGGTTGGNAGSISIETRDANADGMNDVHTGELTAFGGMGANGAGGRGGSVSVNTRQSIAITGAANAADDQPAAGAGNIEIAGIEAHGGGVDERATVGGNGGNGGSVSVATEKGNVTIDGTIVTLGGDAHKADSTGVGGRGGAVALSAGTAKTATGDLQFDPIDARKGASDANAVLALTDGGNVTLRAAGGVEHGAQAGPHITTEGDVSLTAGGGIGANSPLEIVGGGESTDDLMVSAGGTAVIRVTGRVGDTAPPHAGFGGLISAIATQPGADIDVQQSGATGGDRIQMDGDGSGAMVVTHADGAADGVDMEVGFADPNDGALVLAADSVKVGGRFLARSDGDIVIGSAIQSVGKAIELRANSDGDDKGGPNGMGGALREAGGVIDLSAADGTDGRADLVLIAGDGIGASGAPISITGGGELTALNTPLKDDGDPQTQDKFIPNPQAHSGIFVDNSGSGELRLVTGTDRFGVQNAAGDGDIAIRNLAGDLRVQTAVQDKPLPTPPATPGGTPIDNGPGGDITLAGSRIVLDSRVIIDLTSRASIASGGQQIYDGDVAVARPVAVVASGGLAIHGTLDTDEAVETPASFSATVGAGSASQIDGAVGARGLSSFALLSSDAASVANLALGGGSVNTTGSQTYQANLTLGRDTALTAGTTVDVAGKVTGPAGGLTVSAPAEILFSGTGPQSVQTAGAIALNPAGRTSVPVEASIARPSGDLSLTSTGGSVVIGDREKVSAAGSLALSGRAVRFTDLSALDISVTSPDIEIFSREAAPVALPRGGVVLDAGTDVVANSVSFSSAPVAVASGPLPRVATLSGAATNPGALGVTRLPAPITVADIGHGSRAFDLVIPTVNPGHETQEITAVPLEPALAPQVSGDPAAPAAAVSREQVVAFLSCAPLGEEFAPAGCSPTGEVAYGSALDTERASEVARAYRTLLGDGAREVAGRESLSRAAADPKAEIGNASSPAGGAYLTEIARVLGQVRLLGLGETYPEVRADLLAAVARAIGAPQLDAARLGAAVDARAMGMPI